MQASSNECDCPAKTDFRLGKQGNWDILNFAILEIVHIEVIRHSTAKLNKMKTDKYNPIKHEVEEDNIKIEVPDEMATDMHTNLF